jgi:hypothetical protein
MKTIEIQLYKFNELNEEGKQNAINNERENVCVQFIYDDAYNTVKAFNDVFGLSERSRSWLDFSTSKIVDSILELKGFRLQKYILNNYGSKLFKKAYLKHGELRDKEISFWHPMRKYKVINKGLSTGKFSISYYSNWKTKNSCVLTGMCYDDDMLSPIYHFLQKRDFSNCTIDFQDLLNDCFHEMQKTIDSEVEYRNSDEAIAEELTEGENDFTENGKMY